MKVKKNKKAWIAEHSRNHTFERRLKIMAENKPTNRERLREIRWHRAGIKELFESEKYMRYLSVMSRCRYSVNNTMLIYMRSRTLHW